MRKLHTILLSFICFGQSFIITYAQDSFITNENKQIPELPESIRKLENQNKRIIKNIEREADIRSKPDKKLDTPINADEASCFTINKIELYNRKNVLLQDLSKTEFIQKYIGKCMGTNGVNQVLNSAQNYVVNNGWVTTRLIVPEQDLSSGKLKLVQINGVLGSIHFAPNTSTRACLGNAIPIDAGDKINVRDLEQGLEQLKRSGQLHTGNILIYH